MLMVWHLHGFLPSVFPSLTHLLLSLSVRPSLSSSSDTEEIQVSPPGLVSLIYNKNLNRLKWEFKANSISILKTTT